MSDTLELAVTGLVMAAVALAEAIAGCIIGVSPYIVAWCAFSSGGLFVFAIALYREYVTQKIGTTP